ncbi:MAG: hypothetical protein ACI4NP_03885 [Thermoguttaceae bacterium]
MTLSSLAFLPLNAQGETSPLLSLDVQQESFSDQDYFYYNDAPFLWRIQRTSGVITVFDISSQRPPLRPDDGVVYQPSAAHYANLLPDVVEPPRLYRLYDRVYVILQEPNISSSYVTGVLLEDGRFLERSMSLISVEPKAEGRIAWKLSAHDVLTRVSKTKKKGSEIRFLSLNYLSEGRTLQLLFSTHDKDGSLLIEPSVGKF